VYEEKKRVGGSKYYCLQKNKIFQVDYVNSSKFCSVPTCFFFLERFSVMNQLGVFLIGNVFATSYSLITDILPRDLLGHSDQPR
jgi:hypothetical protein